MKFALHRLTWGGGAEVRWYHAVWKLPLTNKIEIFMWKISIQQLPTISHLQKIFPITSTSCFFSGSIEETTDRLFFQCGTINYLWNILFRSWKIQWSELDSIMLLIQKCFDLNQRLLSGILLYMLCFGPFDVLGTYPFLKMEFAYGCLCERLGYHSIGLSDGVCFFRGSVFSVFKTFFL